MNVDLIGVIMMSLGSVRYKMHRATNYLFYGGLIGIGFLLGVGIKMIANIDLTSILSQIKEYLYVL